MKPAKVFFMLLLKFLYERYGRTGQCFTTQGTRIAGEDYSGEDWKTFFDSYIYGSDPLPLKGEFAYR
jgi:hypothetical protein